jgi:hypothetical protein
MAGETFQLRFRNNEDVTVSIDEPINFATVDFQLSQKDKGYGRDVSFNGGEVQFEFVKYRNHYLDKLLSYNKTYGFESIVELIITCGSITTIIGELDFATAITDDFEYFKCKVIQQSSKQIVKRRKAVKVDLLSNKDIDGNPITPLEKKNLILIAKPLYQSSRLEQKEDVIAERGVYSSGGGRTYYRLWARQLTDYSIDDTYSPIDDGTSEGAKILTAQNALRNINIKVSDFTCEYKLYNSSGGGVAIGYFGIRWGLDFASAVINEVRIPESEFYFDTGGQTRTYTKSLNVTIPSLPTTHSVWVYHNLYVRHSGGGYSEVKITQNKMNIDLVAETLASDSVVFSFRLVDVMRQVVKSISGLDIYAPRFDVAGEFYDNRLVNGNFLRKIDTILDKDDNLINKAFLISLEDLEKSLAEFNADWEINNDGDVFFGIEDDFYIEQEIKKFTNTQFSSFNKSFNPKFQINEFNYGYKTFQSLKENEESYSADVINGQSKWVLQNKSVENKKDVSIDWIRDSFSIESNRRKALEIESNTASQEDDSLFIIDSKDTPSNQTNSDSSICSHRYIESTGFLGLQSTVNFELLPFNVGDVFKIVSPTAINIGTYIVNSIVGSKIELDRRSDPAPTTGVVTTYNWDDNNSSTTPNPMIKTYTFTHNYTKIIFNRTLRLSKSTVFSETYSAGHLIEITTCPINKGKYEILNVNNVAGDTYLDLTRLDDPSVITGIGTNFEYTLNPSVNPFTSYTNGGFTNINNLVAEDKFANLRYSIRRNIEKYWKKYLSTCNLYKRTRPINNTWYKNNRYFTATYNGLTLTESDPITSGFIDSKPNLTPVLYNDVVFANVEFSDFIQLQNDIRTTRGYITTYDNNGLEIKIYPVNMKYENLSKQLTIKGEEKFTSTFVPTIETVAITNILSTQASSGGNILSNGYSPITAKGIVWGTSPNPTTALSTKTSQGTGDASFTSVLTSLTVNTLYYVRAYATNSNGTSYGSQVSFTTAMLIPTANNDTYNVNNEDVIDLFPMSNDTLGEIPTTITAINTTGITTGTIAITGSGSKLTFTPNGIFVNGQTFTYTITDSQSNTSTATITLNVEEFIAPITEYFTAELDWGRIEYINELGVLAFQDIYSYQCVAITYKEIILTFQLIPCTP